MSLRKKRYFYLPKIIAFEGNGGFIRQNKYIDKQKENPLFLTSSIYSLDCLCGIVVRVPGYRSRGLGSIPGVPHFLKSSGSGTGYTQPSEYN
jgi:hypothetical protein